MTHLKKRYAIRCYAGIAMLAVWLLSQTVQFTFKPVYSSLSTSIMLDEGGYILLSAMWLVANNAMRAIFLYSGWVSKYVDGAGAIIKPPGQYSQFHTFQEVYTDHGIVSSLIRKLLWPDIYGEEFGESLAKKIK